MIKKRNLFFYSIFLIVFLSCKKENKKKDLIIAVASNMQFAAKEIIDSFSKDTNISCTVITSSSGKLATQIMQGAPYDIFISADMKYPKEVSKRMHLQNIPKIYAYGKLVLWSMNDKKIKDIHIILNKKTKHIAIANPKIAPYGIAANAFLKTMKYQDTIKDKLVFGESISQVNQFILSHAANIGFTAKSVVLSQSMKNKGSWIEIDTTLYPPIQQGVLVLNTTSKSAETFYTYLFSNSATTILEKFGYIVPE